jgi:hypothetical protein
MRRKPSALHSHTGAKRKLLQTIFEGPILNKNFYKEVQVGAINFCVGSKFQIVNPLEKIQNNCMKKIKRVCVLKRNA